MAKKELRSVLADKERFPLTKNLNFLNRLRQHEFAPRFNFKSGDRLDGEKLEKVKIYYDQLKYGHYWFKQKGENGAPVKPDWLSEHIGFCREKVPFYCDLPEKLTDIPTINREDLRKTPWNFVSDDADIDDLLVYSTSGTTGPPVEVLFDAVTQGCYLPQLIKTLSEFNVHIEGGDEKVAIALICHQEETLTYASLSSYLNNSGVLKINLNEGQWQKKDHSRKFLESLNPEILTGDPFAFSKLMEISPDISPKALVSSASTLLPGLREKLENYFNCPVLDIYSLTECRMIAYAREDSHRLIRPDLYVEVFDSDEDKILNDGEFGEITITTGLNPFLNLVRYRTGDFGALKWDGDQWGIKDFQGRKPVNFYNYENKLLNSVDLARGLSYLKISGYRIVQKEDKKVSAIYYGDISEIDIFGEVLANFFGDLSIVVTQRSVSDMPDGKIVPFESRWNK